MSVEALDRHRQTREEFGLRADPEWVAWVAEHGRDGGTMMMLPIPLTAAEIADLASRSERGTAANGAWLAADLPSAAGLWIDQRAGGVIRYLLAHPDPDDLATAEAIVAEHGGTIEFVEHSLRELERARALVGRPGERSSELAAAVTGSSIDVWANAARITLRGDLDPELPPSVRDAVAAGKLIIEHPREPYGWDPLQEAPPRPPADAPVPRWPRVDGEIDHEHWLECVRFVAGRCTGGPLAEAVRLGEEIGLRVRVIHPGDGVPENLVIGRVTVYVNSEHVVRRVDPA